MSRVLVTGATSAIGTALVRRLLSDPAYEVRVSEERPVPRWMREGCEVHAGDLRLLDQARRATAGCTHVIHLAASAGTGAEANLDTGTDAGRPHTLLEVNNALHNAVIRAALELEVERFAYVSSALVFERATEFPTTEAHLPDCPTPRSAAGFSELAGEVQCRAAHDEHGLQYTICRPFDPYGPDVVPARAVPTDETPAGAPATVPHAEPEIAEVVDDLIAQILCGRRPPRIHGSGEQTRTPTHVDDIADGIVTAIGSPRGRNEDFNIAAARELTVAELARIVWEACGEGPADFALAPPSAGADSAVDVPRRRPSVEKARELLGWQARIGVEDGIEATVESIRQRGSIGSLQ
ncbi:MAG TPA: NAD(P)-dependent oxidoreductase [Solirubrobacteraceae bacterium]|jgi:nucleoside-diphosphate-sugar epimerase